MGLALLYRSLGRDGEARESLAGLVTGEPHATPETYLKVVRTFSVLGDAEASREWAARARSAFPVRCPLPSAEERRSPPAALGALRFPGGGERVAERSSTPPRAAGPTASARFKQLEPLLRGGPRGRARARPGRGPREDRATARARGRAASRAGAARRGAGGRGPGRGAGTGSFPSRARSPGTEWPPPNRPRSSITRPSAPLAFVWFGSRSSTRRRIASASSPLPAAVRVSARLMRVAKSVSGACSAAIRSSRSESLEAPHVAQQGAVVLADHRAVRIEGERPLESLLGQVEVAAPVGHRRHHEVREGAARVERQEARDLADRRLDGGTGHALQDFEALVDRDQPARVGQAGLVDRPRPSAARRVAEAAQPLGLLRGKGHRPHAVAAGRERGHGRLERRLHLAQPLRLFRRIGPSSRRDRRQVEELGLPRPGRASSPPRESRAGWPSGS